MKKFSGETLRLKREEINLSLEEISHNIKISKRILKKIEDSNSQGWIVSVDSEGNQNWERLYGGNDVEVFYSIKQTSDMGYILTGETNSNGVSDIYHVKTDPYGEVITSE